MYQNWLLELMSDSDRLDITPHLEHVALPLKMALHEPLAPIRYCYFLTSGAASVVVGKGPNKVEVGFIGCEGLTGLPALQGAQISSQDCFMQLAGEGYRIDPAVLNRHITRSGSLRTIFEKYVHLYIEQIAQTALVNQKAKLSARLARWLLMADDRVIGPNFSITHDFLALMLGVRRPGVTVALQELEGDGLIKATRCNIKIRNRNGLKLAAGWSYGAPEAEYDRILPPPYGALGRSRFTSQPASENYPRCAEEGPRTDEVHL